MKGDILVVLDLMTFSIDCEYDTASYNWRYFSDSGRRHCGGGDHHCSVRPRSGNSCGLRGHSDP